MKQSENRRRRGIKVRWREERKEEEGNDKSQLRIGGGEKGGRRR